MDPYVLLKIQILLAEKSKRSAKSPLPHKYQVSLKNLPVYLQTWTDFHALKAIYILKRLLKKLDLTCRFNQPS